MITKQETQQVKGMAILAMLVLHLFCTLEPGDMFTPLVYVTGVPLSYFFGQAADFCVMAFCFVSGYGLYSAYQKSNLSAYVKGRQRSIAAFLSNYWLILLLYAGVALITGHAGEWLGSWKEFLTNVLLKSSYNGAWWFVLTYVLMVVLSPAVFYMVDRHPVVVAVLSPVVYTASYVVRFKIEPDWLPMQFALLGMSFAELLIGVYFCKYRFMDTLQSAWNHLSAKICGGGVMVSRTAVRWHSDLAALHADVVCSSRFRNDFCVCVAAVPAKPA